MLYHLFHELFPGRHYAYENPLFRGTCAALLCFVLGLVFLPRVIRQLIKWKLGDRPEFDHISLNELTRSKSNVPTMGGLAMAGMVAIAMLLLADLTNFYVWMSLVCLAWLGALGAVDDWLKLTAKQHHGVPGRFRSRDGLFMYEKLLFQIGLGVILGFYIYNHGSSNYAVLAPLVEPQASAGADVPLTLPAYRILAVPFYKAGLQLGAVAFMVVTVLVMTATSNAVNLTDGMDGLAAGCVAMCALVFAILTYVVGTEELAHKLLFPHIPKSGELVVLCGAILGSCLGFLWYNCHPARVFMGDTGSLPLGGLIGYVAIVTRQELMLLIAGGIFVLEAGSVLAQVGYFKWTGGRRLLRCAPIHHHFHLGGWSEPQTVVRFWLGAAMFAALALATIKLR